MFLKPTAAFKLDQSTKRIMARIIDPDKRSEYKKIMIEAQLASLIAPKIVKNRKEEKESE